MQAILSKAKESLKKDGVQPTLKKSWDLAAHWLLQKNYPPFYMLRRPILSKRRRQAEPVLRKMIQGRRVLIAGSGPSAADFSDEIPADVRIFTCNRGLKFFENRRLKRPVDLFMCTAGKIQRMEEIGRLLSFIKTNILVIDDPGYARKAPLLRESYQSLVYDDGKDDFYLKKIVGTGTSGMRGRSYHPWTSTGIRLLQYALYFGAAEIYLSGIDLGKEGYFWGPFDTPWYHDDIDENFLKIVPKRFPNVFSASAQSPVNHYLPFKKL